MRAGLPSRSAASTGSITASCAFASLSSPRTFFCVGDEAALEAVEVGEHQLGLDRLGVAHRIDRALDMGDVAVLEAAQHMGDGVDLADVAEELVAEALAVRRAAHQAGDVDELELGRHDLRRLAELARRMSSRGSGTATRPTLGSIVQNG